MNPKNPCNMKHDKKPLLAAIGLFAMLFGLAFGAAAQGQQTLVLRQDLLQSINTVNVYGLHNVTVIPDTTDYIQTTVNGSLSQADSLRQPLKSMTVSGGVLDIPASFPYLNGIDIHTTSQRLYLHSYDDSRLWLSNPSRDTLHLEMLVLEARGHSTLLLLQPVEAQQAWVQSNDFATLRHRGIASDDLTRTVKGESRTEQMGVEDQEEAFQLNLSPTIHRLFGGVGIGISGWSQRPLGGTAVAMDDYQMNPTASLGCYDLRLGWNFLRLKHWDFGVGIGFTSEVYIFPRLMGTTVDPATGLTHFGPVDEPAYYNKPFYAGQKRVWRSSLQVLPISLPLRVEWHRRLDYRGLRISAELRPAIQLSTDGAFMRSQCTWTEGPEAENGRIDILNDTIGDIWNRFRLDLRLDIGWNRLSFFVQGSLTPLFRTARKDDLPTLDTKVYPLCLGISLNY